MEKSAIKTEQRIESEKSFEIYFKDISKSKTKIYTETHLLGAKKYENPFNYYENENTEKR